MAVHDVEVQQVGAAGLDRTHLVSHPREVARQQRRRDADPAHLLTHSPTTAASVTGPPAVGSWRSTVPCETPG